MVLSELLRVVASLENSLPEVYEHSLAVAKLALNIARYINSSPDEIELLVIAALLHDLGKTRILKEILGKPSPLNQTEWELMKRHPQLGIMMLEGLNLPDPIPDYILYHHEWWNGSGYLGIKGENIPGGARLITLCDSWDAMTTSRPYQRQRSVIQAEQEIIRMSGKQFDPRLAKLFLEMVRNKSLKSPEKLLEIERQRTQQLINSYNNLLHPVVYVPNLCLDDLIVPITKDSNGIINY